MSSTRKRNLDSRKSQGRRLLPNFFHDPPPGLFPSCDEFLKLLVVVALAASVAFCCHFVSTFRHRPDISFCDSAENSLDYCDPCPEHAECIKGKWECLLGYKKKGSRCVEDDEISRKLDVLSELVVDYTCGGQAKFLCYHSGITWFSESNVLNMLDHHRFEIAQGMENETWDFLILKAVKAAEKSLEIRTLDDGTKEVQCPASLAELHKPYSCRILLWIQRHVVVLAPISVLISVAVLLLIRLHQKRYTSSRVQQLYEQVCEILKESSLNGANGGENWVGLSWLRDHLLSPRERKNSTIWKKVEELILEDSRIDQYPKMIKGEQKVVLEWQVEGYLRSERMMAKKTATVGKILKERDVQSVCFQMKQNFEEALRVSKKDILLTD